MPNTEQVKSVITTLSRRYPAKGMVDLGNPEDTLIATLLSARTTDKQVIKVYPGFRRAFPTLEDLAKADVAEIEKEISTIGLYKNKAKAIKGLANMLLNEFAGKVPETMEELIRLPGVGRKTASCVLWYAFRKPAIAVDTHVFRIAHRLGWARGRSPEKVEEELKALVPKSYWGKINRAFVHFGRDICKSPRPECWRCPVRDLCAYEPKTRAPMKAKARAS
jgi:endonuclease-3